MRPIDDFSFLSPEERHNEVAGIFAAGILRLHSRAALPVDLEHLSARDVPEDSAVLRLELRKETVLSVHTG